MGGYLYFSQAGCCDHPIICVSADEVDSRDDYVSSDALSGWRPVFRIGLPMGLDNYAARRPEGGLTEEDRQAFAQAGIDLCGERRLL